jgi:hypothetical protein
MGLISCASIGLDAAIKEPNDKNKHPFEMIETIVYEKSWFTELPFWLKLIIFGMILLWGIMIFYQQTGELSALEFGTLGAPEYDVIGLGAAGNALLSMTAGFIENYAWFSVAPTLFGFSLLYYMFGGMSNDPRAKKFAMIMGIMGFFVVGTGVWVWYHWFRYGLANLSATVEVAEFAFINLIWVFATRNILLPMVWHGFNNLGYRLQGTHIGLYQLFGPWVIVGLAVIIGYNVFVHYGLEKRKFSAPKIPSFR